MITIFSIPKAFNDHANIIQRNAIQSWLKLGDDVEVILFGKDNGVQEIAQEFQIKSFRDIECNEFGTPLLNSVFATVQKISKFSTYCYVNSDIIFPPDSLKSIKQILNNKYLLVGQRWDTQVDREIDFHSDDWFKRFKQEYIPKGKIHPPAGSDYFIYPKGLFDHLPAFAVGRPYWDNWMFYHAKKKKIPIIDMTKDMLVIHQNHDYAHIKDGDSKSYNGSEGEKNKKIFLRDSYLLTINDSDYMFEDNGIHKAQSSFFLKKYLYHFLAFHPTIFKVLNFFYKPFKAIVKHS